MLPATGGTGTPVEDVMSDQQTGSDRLPPQAATDRDPGNPPTAAPAQRRRAPRKSGAHRRAVLHHGARAPTSKY